jgi:hypothetical protein
MTFPLTHPSGIDPNVPVFGNRNKYKREPGALSALRWCVPGNASVGAADEKFSLWRLLIVRGRQAVDVRNYGQSCASVEIHRIVNATGTVSIAGKPHSVG